MKIAIHQLSGEVNVDIFGKCGYRIKTESFFGKVEDLGYPYIRKVDIGSAEVVSTRAYAVKPGSFIRYEVL